MTTLLRKMWKNNSKHKKLCEEWALAECEGEGWWREAREAREGRGHIEVRYAGVAPVERAASAPATALAVRSALHTAKTVNKKLQRVNLDISPRGILVSDAESQANVLSLSIYRQGIYYSHPKKIVTPYEIKRNTISYCSADAANARVFAVVEGAEASAHEAEHAVHVFVCARRRHARSLALSLAHAFNDAYQAWQANEAASIKYGGKRLITPWVNFPDESDDDLEEQWDAPAPLVTFA